MLTQEFVFSFREAAPYINAFRGKTFVIALSGEAVAGGNLAGLAQDINLLVSLGVRVVVVHGGRPQIAALLARNGLMPRFHDGRRITDAPTLEAVKQAQGMVRYEIEAALSMGMPNSPMHNAHLRVSSGNVLTARPLGVIDGVDYFYSGQVRRIDTEAINQRLDTGELVLISPIGYSPTGEVFNLMMEEVATQTASALRAEKLIFLIESRGVTGPEGQFVSTLNAHQAEDLLARNTQPVDVCAYLACAVRAVREGVPRAHLVSHREDGALLVELFTSGGNGTMVSRDPLVKVRNAGIEDIGNIIALIRPLEEQGVLVKRSREHLEMEIDCYSVLEHDGKVYGCVAMHTFPGSDMAELACLVVSRDKRDAGFGETLLHHVEQKARLRGMHALFVLTTQTAHWFVERGFSPADPSQLPPPRQRLYNTQRRSKVLIKPL